MPEVNLIFIPAIFLIGIVTSCQDIRSGKIRHKWIIAGLALSLSGYLLLYLLSILKVIDQRAINYVYIRDLLFNWFISVCVAYFLWKLRIWAAGDAKLFIVYALLIPLDYYSRNYISYFPSFVLLLNIFVPLFGVILIIALWQLGKLGTAQLMNHRGGIISLLKEGRQKAVARLHSSRRNLLGVLLSYTIILLGFQVLTGGLRVNPVWAIVPMLIVSPLISRGFKKGRAILLLGGMLVLAYSVYEVGYLHRVREFLGTLKSLVRLLLVFGVLRWVLDLYFRYTQVYRIDIHKLRSGMLLSDELMKKLQKEMPGFLEGIGAIYPDGLSEEQVGRMRNIYMEKGYREIEVCRTFPFAVWMFLGVLLTLGLKQSVLHLFR